MARWLCIALSGLLWTRVAHADGMETLQMVAGQQRVLSAPGVSRIAIANPNVADVKVVSASEVLVTANNDGRTELTIWRGSRSYKFEIIVSTMDPRELRREVERLLGQREGLSVRVVRDQVYIEGEVLTLEDMEKAEEIATLYPQVRNLTRLSPTAHSHVAAAINKNLRRAGIAKATATVVGKTIFLEGVVDSDADLQKIEFLTRGMGENIQSVVRVSTSRMVELDVEFVEVSKSSLDRIGVRWPTDISGALTLDYAQTNVITGTLTDSQLWRASGTGTASFGVALQFADGVSRVLAHPRLVTGSNRPATFLAGGEIPIPIISEERMYVEYKEYGIRLNITPIADASGAIQTKVMTEISQIDDSVAVQGIPGLLTRRVDTEVTLKDGETIALTGLVHVAEGKDVSKVPLLGHIPIIGELFKSRRFQERRTELVVFVTPRIVDPMSAQLRQVITDMQERYRQAQDDIGFGLFD